MLLRREARDDAEAKRVAADLMGDSSRKHRSRRKRRDRARGSSKMGTVDVDDPILSPPGSPASSTDAEGVREASTGLFEGSSTDERVARSPWLPEGSDHGEPAAARGAVAQIQAMGTVDVDAPGGETRDSYCFLSPPGSPASSSILLVSERQTQSANMQPFESEAAPASLEGPGLGVAAARGLPHLSKASRVLEPT